MANKYLIIRFTSIGDIIQSLSIPAVIRRHDPGAEIHWVTRKDMAPLIAEHPAVDRIFGLDRKEGFSGLQRVIQQLKGESYTHIYDAHNNLRSRLISWALNGPLGLFRLWRGHRFLRRSQYRMKRFFLFRFRINLYPKPFIWQWALIAPLARWGVSTELPPAPQLFLTPNDKKRAHSLLKELPQGKKNIALAPSASYELKRWPPKHWMQLIQSAPEYQFVLLGGPEDQFIEEIAKVAPQRCFNFAGKLSLTESAAMIQACDFLIANDTGLLHVADQLGLPCLGFLGPAPFGHPARQTTEIKERMLSCRPCSKHGQGPCTNSVYQKCLVDITPDEVVKSLHDRLTPREKDHRENRRKDDR